MQLRAVVKIIGLGWLTWGASLAWPEINQELSAEMMRGLTAGLGMIILLSLANRQQEQYPAPGRVEPDGCSSRPVAVVRNQQT